jgi:transposase
MKNERKHYTAEEKVAILRRHLLDEVAVSELCEEKGLRPTVFYRWQKEFFEHGAAAFEAKERPSPDGCSRFCPARTSSWIFSIHWLSTMNLP